MANTLSSFGYFFVGRIVPVACVALSLIPIRRFRAIAVALLTLEVPEVLSFGSADVARFANA